MPEGSDTKKRLLGLPPLYYLAAVLLLWTVLLASSYAWMIYLAGQNLQNIARAEARIAFKKDVLYRKWNASHGGVYAPVTPSTPPNSNLSHVPERDLTTPSGKKLTLINPAYMTRQVYEAAVAEDGPRGHITSLKPINDINAPDEWERAALMDFEKGVQEVSGISDINKKPYMRLMRPFTVDEFCMKCHAGQGYKIGDIRGGISVAIPMQMLVSESENEKRWFVKIHLILWVLGTGMISFGGWRIIGDRRFLHLLNEKLESRVDEEVRNNREKDHLIIRQNRQAALGELLVNISHQWRQPLNEIGLYVQGLQFEMKEGELSQKELDSRLENIMTIVWSLSKTINDFSIMSRKDEKASVVNSCMMVDQAISMVSAALRESGIEIVHEKRCNAMLFGYPHDFVQSLVNILNNSKDALIENGTENPRITVTTESDSRNVLITIRDNAGGIPENVIERIFDPYFTTKFKGKGTGLGLFMTRQIVEREMNGRVWASNDNAGAVVCMEIPCSQE